MIDPKKAMLIAQAKRYRDFDLQIGDKVKTRNDSGRWELYRVTGIYRFIFTVENLESGQMSSFPKVDALTGVVKKCL